MRNFFARIKTRHSKLMDYLIEPFARAFNFFVCLWLVPRVKAKIKIIQSILDSEGNVYKNPELFLASSYRVDSRERQEIFEATMKINLRELAGSGLAFRAADASPSEYFNENNKFLNGILDEKANNISLKARLPESYQHLLLQAKEKYFCQLFDDMPVVGLTPKFLAASTRVLEEFEGLVDIILIEQITEFDLDKGRKQINLKASNLEFLEINKTPLGVVSYQGYDFAILSNYHYGFFFNTLIASCKDYARRLKWYMEHTSFESPHKIELSGMRRIGPVYRFIAVPLNVFRLDIDYAHSNTSIRGVGEKTKDLFEAIRDGFSINLRK